MNRVNDNALKTLEDLFFVELEGMYDAESRIARMLPVTGTDATCWKLKKCILTHLLETEGHVLKLERVFGCFDRRAAGHTCKTTVGMVEQSVKIAVDFAGSPAINAAIIAFLQKIESHEIAAYTCLREWALLLGYPEAADLIAEILDEEYAASQAFAELALSTINEEAICRYGWEESSETFGLDAAAG
jgi:ferritin-like metal-binding protein YciE